MKISVVTATFNRANLLPRLFNSLKNQTFKNFEWIIIDDGSTDSTTDVVNKFNEDKPFFQIKYSKVDNGGKHRAINIGLHLADGEMTLIMDSDDWLSNDALKKIVDVEKTILDDDKENFAGVYGLKVYSNGELVGSTFSGNYLDATFLQRGKNNIHGDKCEVYYTSILKKYPFPEFENEKFCTECLVWDKIAAEGYKIRFFNEKIYYCDYLEDGLTKQGNMLYVRNPKQYGLFVFHSYFYKKQNKCHSSIKIYEYYLYEKNFLSFKEIVSNLHLNKFIVSFWICYQFIFDVLRKILRKNTIRRNVKKDLENF